MNNQKAIILFTCLLVAISFKTKAGNNENLNFYGFVRNELFHDSYKGVASAMDQFYLAPNYIGKDANENHLNHQGSAHFTAIATRIGLKISGPEILNAATTANIEADFMGITSSDPVVIRLRKAYYKFSWESSNLTVGQDWHPLFGGSVFPIVTGLNTGAPFHPFNRSPLINYTQTFGKLALSGAAVFENQYVSRGFYTTTNSTTKTLAKRNAAIPEFVLKADWTGGGWTLGIAGEHNVIKPIDTTSGTDGIYLTKQLNSSNAFLAYSQYKKSKFKVLTKAVIGQNLCHLTMLGGYGVKSVDPSTGAYTYTNYNHLYSMLNILYGIKYQVGVFAGYLSNLGTTDPLAIVSNGQPKITGLLPNIQDMLRFSSSFSYNITNFKFAMEWELTSANYGSGEINAQDGRFSTFENARNNRILFSSIYFF